MRRTCVLMICAVALPAWAGDKQFSFAVDPVLVEAGLMKHLLPRFSLKTGVSVELVEGTADLVLGDDGVAAIAQGDTVWSLSEASDEDALRFTEWLLSETGARTIASFGGGFGPAIAKAAPREEIAITGDLVAGERAALAHCGRCHVVNDSNRMKTIGSTPSFALMRNFTDWDVRFATFWDLKPHGAFTQIEGVTPPFDPERPSPIAPVAMTMQDVDAILAYVASIAPSDLGAPIQSQ